MTCVVVLTLAKTIKYFHMAYDWVLLKTHVIEPVIIQENNYKFK